MFQGPVRETESRWVDRGQIYRVKDPGVLLKQNEHQQIIEKIKRIAQLPPKDFKALYQSLIYSFADFVQALPAPDRAEYSILNLALSRAYLAISHTVADAMPHRERYALFSAALLQDLGAVVSHWRIWLTNEMGQAQCLWLPLDKRLVDGGGYYKFRAVREIPKSLPSLVNPVMARAVMPPLGWQWLSESTPIFAEWLAVLSNHRDQIGRMGDDIARADRELLAHVGIMLPDLLIDPLHPPEMASAEAFWLWLRMQIRAHALSINEAGAAAHLAKAGLLLDFNQLYKRFKQAHGRTGSANELYKQLMELGLFESIQEGSRHTSAHHDEHSESQKKYQHSGLFGADRKDPKLSEYGLTQKQVSQAQNQVVKQAHADMTNTQWLLIRDADLLMSHQDMKTTSEALPSDLHISDKPLSELARHSELAQIELLRMHQDPLSS